jgi:hypothetical protein
MSELRHISLVDEVTFSVWISAATADLLAVKEQMSNADNCYITKLKTWASNYDSSQALARRS